MTTNFSELISNVLQVRGARIWSTVVALVSVFTVIIFCVTARAEDLKIPTAYPSPAGGYASLLTTGDTLLARDGGRACVGVNALACPAAYKLYVNGTGNVGTLSAPQIDVAGAFTGNGAVTAGGVDVSLGDLAVVGTVNAQSMSVNGRDPITNITCVGKISCGRQGNNEYSFSCISDNRQAACTATKPSCRDIHYGKDNCGRTCSYDRRNVCCPGTKCTAAHPACGHTTYGHDDCGASCHRHGPACLYRCPSIPNDMRGVTASMHVCAPAASTCRGQTTTNRTCRYHIFDQIYYYAKCVGYRTISRSCSGPIN